MTVLARGATIGGDFRIERALASGGMGAVYVAEQRSTGAMRAVKVMRPELVADEGMRKRFLQEAKVSATIESDHVAKVLTAGVDDALGIPYLVMELLEGAELDDLVSRRGPLAADDADMVLEQIAHGLGAAAKKGIIHRDLKPENVFVCASKTVGVPFTVKVLDFGIAKLAAATAKTTRAMGTPYWLAPEQLEARSDVGPSADVWPFGLLAFWLLTGEIFWESAHDDEAPVAAWAFELAGKPIPPASERARVYGAELPPWFDAWFAKCVERDRSARFADVATAYAAFREARGARGPSAGDAVRAWIEPERAPATAKKGATEYAEPLPPPPPGPAPKKTKRKTKRERREEPKAVIPRHPGKPTPAPKLPLWPFAVVGATLLAIAAFFALPGARKPETEPEATAPSATETTAATASTTAPARPSASGACYQKALAAALAAQDDPEVDKAKALLESNPAEAKRILVPKMRDGNTRAAALLVPLCANKDRYDDACLKESCEVIPDNALCVLRARGP